MSDWENRQLCPDGSCIGVIGPDGTCKTCGRAAPNWGDERRRGTLPVEETAGDAERPAADPVVEGARPADASEGGTSGASAVSGVSGASGDPDWDQRTLCPDGGCTGVVQASGRCSVCGRSPSEIQP